MRQSSLFKLVEYFEKVLAGVVLVVTGIFAVLSAIELSQLDFAQVDSFISVLEHVLYVAIGIELARLLLDYSLESLVELLAFVIARKVLLIEGQFLNILLAVVSLAVLFYSRHYFPRTFNNNGESSSRKSKR